MKTKKFTFGIIVFLFAFIANFTVAQAQVTVWDDFEIADGPLTDVNGISGSGWDGAWTYDSKTSGITVTNGAFEATDGGFGINRNLTTSIPLGSSTFYISYVVKKNATGKFRIAGLRADGIERYSIGIDDQGALYGNIAMNGSTVSGNAGLIEDETTYLVIAKWWYEGAKGHMNMVAYKGGESMPVDEPLAGAWNFEEIGGTTGVIVDKIRIAYSAANVNLYDFKISESWASATDGKVLLAPSNISTKATSSTTATILWSDNAYNEEGSKIYLDGIEVGTVGPDVEQYELTGLTNLTEYKVGISAYQGAEETAVSELTFTFELDETAPTVVETSPANNAVDVDETSDISITFSEAMDQASVESAITVAPALANAVFTWDSETKLTISADDLASETLYTVTIGTGATDLSGNAIAEFVTSFTVILKDVIPPAIIETTPVNSATDVLVTSGISITFSEGMNKTSVEGAVTVAPEIPNSVFTWEGDTQVYLSGDKLVNSTSYTITIGTGAADLKGNVLAAEETVTFTTSASTLQLFDDFSIEDGVVSAANASTGTGWRGSWEYYKGDGGAVALNGYISGGSQTVLVRELNYPSSIGATTYYLSFLALRSPEGSFQIVGGRDWGSIYQWRTGVGVSQDGSLGVLSNAGAYVSSDNPGIFEANTTYLVVMKHTAKISQQVKIFKAGDAITEPADGDWDYELAQGNTGVALEFFGIDFLSAGANIDEFKVGSSWGDISGTTITDLSAIPLIAPGNLEVIATSESTAELWWSDNSVVEEGYKVYMNGSEVADVEADAKVFEFSDLVDNEIYTFKVSAFKGGDEAMSSEISFTFTFDAENYVDTKIEIAKTETAPVIDGDVDDAWADAFKNPVKRVDLNKEAAPVDAADYQSTWSAMWDNNNLYFLFEVNDEKLVFNDGSGTGIGQDDGFDMPMAKGENGAWTMNRVNLIAPPESDTTLYFHEGMAAIKGAEKAYKFTETGYTIEMSVVLRDFDESIGLFVEGYQFRIDVRYNDDDTEGNRDGQYTWSDKNEAGWTWNNINSLGYVTLVGVIDNDAPTVAATTPAANATGVALNSAISVSFSEAMDKASVEGAVTISPDLTNAIYTWNGDTEVSIAADDFTASTAYTVTIATTAEDANGNPLAEEFSFSFTSGEGVGIETVESGSLKVFISENGSLLNIMNYDGMADIYSITGRKVQRIQNASQPVNIAFLSQGIYIVKTDAGAIKFVK